ncbi:uncharacterized protein LOC120350335 isoform X2 [Nilaparvata lugens]|uniref:uncharacterized protein LOC120350335 isoform X2 n=1 Tax=Nilaparvata lugens TaxID=108931 RepID=UPI00193E662E|nr:uncharacterized protein LOC120350335 isoform X2 [Nilaparvata lugens]
MFHMFGSTFASLLNVHKMAWHYSEASHGKGAPDGIGVVKRTADAIVAKGEDIPDFSTLVNKLKEANSLIEIIPIKEGRILDFDQCIPHDVVPFKGTTKIHEITWIKGKDSMQARRLSCTICQFDVTCCHYKLGEIPLLHMRRKPPIRHKSIYKEVYTSSSDEEEEEKTTSNPSFKTPKMNDFVVVKCLGKKSTQHFVAVIDEIINNEEYRVFFLKKNRNYKVQLA